MHAIASKRLTRRLALIIPTLVLAACGQGDGPTSIPGTEGPTPPPPPEGFCDIINFEDACGAVNFINFNGGVSDAVLNPKRGGLNPTAKTARMTKFGTFEGATAAPFGGTALDLGEAIDFSRGESFLVKVLADRQRGNPEGEREVALTFVLEDAASGDPAQAKSRVLNHSGNGDWEQLCFDFSGDTTGFQSSRITFIFDNGVVGNAEVDPTSWTFWYDEIEQVESCNPPAQFPVDFEDDPASYNFGPIGGFGGGASDVITNPDPSGLNTTPQTARMQKFADQPFGGSTLVLGGEVDFSGGEAFTMKVWASRPVPVLFKFEDAVTGLPENGIESDGNHGGSGTWEELCFDFSGRTANFSSDSITFIFDNGVVGDAENDPDNWTFYFDEIEQVANCPGDGGAEFSRITFDDPAVTYTLRGFGGAEDSTLQPDPTDAGNTTAQVNRSDAAADFAGTVISTGPNESVGTIQLDASNTQMSMRVYAPAAGIPIRFKIENAADDSVAVETETSTTIADGWETLVFDFANQVDGTPAFDPAATYDKIAVFPNFGTTGADAGAQTYFYDDIDVVSAGGATSIDFEGDPAQYDFGPDGGFGGGVSTVIANPDPSGINTTAQVVQMQKFAVEDFGGSTLAFPEGVNWSEGETFTMKVWSQRTVPVLFKLEGLDQERNDDHDGGSQWQELCFDFTGTTDGDAVTGITVIFDLGVLGDAENDPDNWTFYYDEIEQTTGGCGGGPVGAFPVDFEGDPASYDFGPDGGFGGGASSVITNPDQSGLNTTAQTAQMQKFAAETFGGSTLSLGDNVDFSQGSAFTMKVWASRSVPVTFKLEDAVSGDPALGKERVLSQSGSSSWEELCFDFSGDTAGFQSNSITFIFDNGVVGDADNDPNAWTFYFDEIEQVADCGIPAASFPVDFEDDPASYDFGPDAGFGGGASTVIANPDQSGLNTTAQTARMQKFAPEPFGGSTLNLGGNVDFSQGTAFRMKVWATRSVPVLFKFEGLNQERTLNHSGSGAWEELCFDFTGSTSGPATNQITFIFDNGVVGDAAGDPDNWTFYFDEIEQAADCSSGGMPTSIDFEGDPAQYDFGPDGGFGGGVSTVIANPDSSGINMTAQVVQMEKFADQPFGGSTLAFPDGFDWSQGEIIRMKVWSQRSVPVLMKLEGLDQERDDNHDGGSTWQELCYDFTGTTTGAPVTGISIFFDLGVVGDAANDPDNWTFYYDEIQQTSDACPTGPVFETITFDDPTVTYTLTDFGNNMSTITNDPAGGTNMVAQVVKPVTAETWAGTTVSTLPAPDDQNVLVIPLTAASSQMNVSVYSPDAGIPVRLKIEDASNGAISVETEAMTTVADEWETLTFDFANEAAGSPVFDEANTYNRISIFFNFNTDGATAGEKIYHFDDVAVGPGGGGVLVNGDFETGDLSGWTLTQVPDGVGSITADSSMQGGRAGTVARLMASGTAVQSNDVLISQESLGAGSINPGDSLDVSFDLYGSLAGAGGVVFVEVIFLNAAGQDEGGRNFVGPPSPYTPTTTWTTHAGTVIAGTAADGSQWDVSGGVTLSIKVACGPIDGCAVDASVDNVTFTIN